MSIDALDAIRRGDSDIWPALAMAATTALPFDHTFRDDRQNPDPKDWDSRIIVPLHPVMSEPSRAAEFYSGTLDLGTYRTWKEVEFPETQYRKPMNTKLTYSSWTHTLFHAAWVLFSLSIVCLGFGVLVDLPFLTSCSPIVLTAAAASLWLCVHRANNERVP